MPKYNEFLWGSGEKYGVTGKLGYSAEPVVATALFYDKVTITWVSPTYPEADSGYSEFRVVRSQEGYPQTQEDGVIVYSSEGPPVDLTVDDSVNNPAAPLQSGRYAYYRVWIKKTATPAGVLTSTWTPAGDDMVLVPSPHNLSVARSAVYSGTQPNGKTTGDLRVLSDHRIDPVWSTTHDRFMELLPGVFTTKTYNAVDVKDDENTVSRFLSAFSFTMDEFLTLTSLIKPDNTTRGTGPAGVYLKSHELGLSTDIESVTDTQNRMIRTAVESYKKKGTAAGIELLAQSMTGLDATVTSTSSNRSALVSVAASWNHLATYISDNDFSVGEYVTVTNLTSLVNEPLNVSVARVISATPTYFAVLNETIGFSAGPGYAVPVSGTTPMSRPHNLLLSHEDATFNITSWKEDAYQASIAVPSEPTPPVGSWLNFTTDLALSVVSDQSPNLITVDAGSRIIDSTYCAQALTSSTNQAMALGTDDPINKGIPVESGLAYTFSAYVKEIETSDGLGEVSMRIIWYDRHGSAIKVDNQAALGAVTTVWNRTVMTATAPAKAIYAGIVLFFSDASTYFIDRVQFEQNSLPSAYQEPRAIVLTLNPKVINYIKDPAMYKDSVGSDPSYWTGMGDALLKVATGAPSTPDYGVNFLQGVSSGLAPLNVVYTPGALTPITAQSGLYYSGSIYVKDISSALPYIATIQFLDLTGTPIGGPVLGTPTFVNTGSWTRVTVTAKAPLNPPVNLVFAVFGVTSAGVPTAGTEAKFDAAQFEQTYLPTDYFDGSLTSDGNVWQGAAHDSFSGKYPAQSTRVTRLKEELKNYVGYGTPWFIDLYNGQYASGIS